ncbi:M23 family metallopeptidase [Spirilliplanes yamanashiensis]|uniref:M23 family metallopeptidase n=1 Tax=Spirilliplanes yamanashiensis TaxID=42233 RepID=UPI0019509174
MSLRLVAAGLTAGLAAGCGNGPAEGTETTWAVPTATPGTTAPATSATAGPSAAADPSAAPSPSAGAEKPKRQPAFAFPVPGANVDYHPTHGKYPATDLFARCGAPVVANVDGVVLEVSRTDRYVKGRPDGPLNGGLSVSVLGDDGVRYYGSHLSRITAGIDAGVRVRAGQRIGAVGRTGNANDVCHLHFGISPPCARTGDWKVRRGVIWPKPYLDSWRAGGSRSAAKAAADWARANDCTA